MIGTATILTREQPLAVGGWAPRTGKSAATKVRVGAVAAISTVGFHRTDWIGAASVRLTKINRTGQTVAKRAA